MGIACKGQEEKSIPLDEKESKISVPYSGSVLGIKPLKSSFGGRPIPDPFFADVFFPGQLCHWVRDLFEDSKGTIWMATNHYGVLRLMGDDLEYFTSEEGFNARRVHKILEDKNGNIWFATGSGLIRYDGKDFVDFNRDVSLFNAEVWCLSLDNSGMFWLGTKEGLFQFDGREYHAFPLPASNVEDPVFNISPLRISHIMEDRSGKMWFGTDGSGLYVYNRKANVEKGEEAFQLYTKEQGLCDNTITNLLEDRAGNIWIGSAFGGLSRFNLAAKEQGENSFENFTIKNEIQGQEIGALYEDKEGDIWISVENIGVYRYNSKHASGDLNPFTLYNEADGLESKGILAIQEDQSGRFWLGGWMGLFRYSSAGKFEQPFVPVTAEGPWEK